MRFEFETLTPINASSLRKVTTEQKHRDNPREKEKGTSDLTSTFCSICISIGLGAQQGAMSQVNGVVSIPNSQFELSIFLF